MRYLVVIPARGGSKGVERKNLRTVAGRPLVTWSIRQAIDASLPGRIVVSTDDAEIASTAAAEGADVPFLRPLELAGDDTPTEPVLMHAVQALASAGQSYDAVMLLQPTSPVRRSGTVRRAADTFEAEGADSLVSVSECVPFLWQNLNAPTPRYDVSQRPRRQDVRPEDRVYRENGSIYITRVSTLMEGGNRVGGRVVLFPLDSLEGVDVDTEDDLAVTDAIISALSLGAPAC